MKYAGMKSSILSVGFLLSLAISSSQAAVIITAEQDSGNVVINATGTLNTTGLDLWSSTSGIGGVWPADGFVRVGDTAGLIRLYRNQTGPITFGSGGFTAATTSNGPSFGLGNNGEWMYIYDGFMSGSAINSGSVYNGATLASLGMDPGTYVWTWASDTITLNVAPEPGSCGLLIAGAGIFAFAARRRKH